MKKKLAAVFTLVRDEKLFLPIWLKHYSKYFSPSDIYILDNETIDGSIKEAQKKYKFHCIPVQTEKRFANAQLFAIAKETYSRLLEGYKYVLFAEADEIIDVNPLKYKGGLKEYIKKISAENKIAVGCTSISPIHLPFEKPIDFTKPLLQQRKYFFQETGFDKIVLTRALLNWTRGFHQLQVGTYFDEDDIEMEGVASGDKVQIEQFIGVSGLTTSFKDSDLYLIHLHRIDYPTCLEKNERNAKSQKVGKVRESIQSFLTGNQFTEWFYTTRLDSTFEKIPEHIRKIV